MAYTRFSSEPNGDWYIFHRSRNNNEAFHRNTETLAVWHVGEEDGKYRKEPIETEWTYPQIKKILEEESFHQFPGYQTKDYDLIKYCLMRFIENVEERYPARTKQKKGRKSKER